MLQVDCLNCNTVVKARLQVTDINTIHVKGEPSKNPVGQNLILTLTLSLSLIYNYLRNDAIYVALIILLLRANICKGLMKLNKAFLELLLPLIY